LLRRLVSEQESLEAESKAIKDLVAAPLKVEASK
jgi:hypothetical protein